MSCMNSSKEHSNNYSDDKYNTLHIYHVTFRYQDQESMYYKKEMDRQNFLLRSWGWTQDKKQQQSFSAFGTWQKTQGRNLALHTHTGKPLCWCADTKGIKTARGLEQTKPWRENHFRVLLVWSQSTAQTFALRVKDFLGCQENQTFAWNPSQIGVWSDLWSETRHFHLLNLTIFCDWTWGISVTSCH